MVRRDLLRGVDYFDARGRRAHGSIGVHERECLVIRIRLTTVLFFFIRHSKIVGLETSEIRRRGMLRLEFRCLLWFLEE